jgi:hypothetical protein
VRSTSIAPACRYGNPIGSLPADGAFRVTLYPVEGNFSVEVGMRANLTLAEANLNEYQSQLQAYVELSQKALKAASIAAKVELALGDFDQEQQAFR